MKSFKQFDESHTVALNSAEDDNLHLANIQDEKVMQRLNGFVGGIAQQEYMQPDAAMKQLQNKLNIVGLSFKEPKIDSCMLIYSLPFASVYKFSFIKST